EALRLHSGGRDPYDAHLAGREDPCGQTAEAARRAARAHGPGVAGLLELKIGHRDRHAVPDTLVARLVRLELVGPAHARDTRRRERGREQGARCGPDRGTAPSHESPPAAAR